MGILHKGRAIAAAVLLATGCSRSLTPLQSGDAAFTTGDIAGAIRIWKDAVASRPDADIYARLVTASLLLNDLPGAEAWATEGLTHFPRCATLLFDRALAAFHTNDYAVALQFLDKTEQQCPYTANVHLVRGLIYEALGQTEQARHEFVAELNINPGCRKAWEKLKEITNEKG